MAQGRRYNAIVKDLSQQIWEGRFALGDRLPPERELAEMYKVSRVPIREAIRALALQGVLERRQGSGNYIVARPAQRPKAGAPPGLTAAQFLEARMVVEGEAAYLAAGRLRADQLHELEALARASHQPTLERLASKTDQDFHLLVVAGSQNEALAGSVRSLWAAKVPAWAQIYTLGWKEPAVPCRSDHHWSILEALSRRDASQARARMRAHLQSELRLLIAIAEEIEVDRARLDVSNTFLPFSSSADEPQAEPDADLRLLRRSPRDPRRIYRKPRLIVPPPTTTAGTRARTRTGRPQGRTAATISIDTSAPDSIDRSVYRSRLATSLATGAPLGGSAWIGRKDHPHLSPRA